MWWGRLVVMGAAAAASAAAQPPETVVDHGAKCCVAADADGSHALSFDCLNAQLSDVAHAPSPMPTLKAADAVGRGNPEALGTASTTATQIRMGSAFGTSVHPERPTQPVAHPVPPGGRP